MNPPEIFSTRTLADGVPGLLAYIDRDCRYRFTNKTYSEWFGFAQSELEGKTMHEVLGEKAWEKLKPWVARALNGERVTYETELPYKAGGTRTVIATYTPHAASDGSIEGFVVHVSDITAQRKAEAELRQSEERFRQLTENIQEVFWMVDSRTRQMLYVSPQYETNWGQSREALYADPATFLNAVHAEDREAVRQHSRDRQEREEASSIEYRVVRSDGTIRWIHDRGFPIRDERGKVYRFAGIAEDITDQRLAEEALEEHEQRLERLVEANVIGLIVADFEGNLLEANHVFLQMVGYSEDDLRNGKINFLELTPPEYAQLDRLAMAEMTATGKHAPFEKEYLRKDGSRVPVVVGTAYLGRGANGVEQGIGFILDLTESKRAQEALHHSEERSRSLMEQAPFSIQLLAADGRTIKANRAWEELWGLEVAQLHDYNVLQDPQLEEKGIAALLRKAFAGEAVRIPASPYDPEQTIPGLSKNKNAVRWVSAVAYPLKDAAGEVREVVLIHEDRTGQVRAEEALKASEEKFRLMAETFQQLAWMARPDGHIFWYNQRWFEYTGTTLEEVEGWGWTTLLDSQVREEVLQQWKQSIETGAQFDRIYPLRGANGKFRQFLTRANPLRDSAGNILYWFGTNTDISEQALAADAWRFLADASALLADVVDYRATLKKLAELAVPRFGDWCAVDLLGPDGQIERVAAAHSDPSKLEILNELRRSYLPDGRVEVGPALVIRTGRPQRGEDLPDSFLDNAARDGTQAALLRALGLKSFLCVPLISRNKVIGALSFMSGDSGKTYREHETEFGEELARRTAVAIENARLYSELRDADRRKDEFLATLAHELRNPLAPIRNSLEILKMSNATPAMADRSKTVIERQLKHLIRLVDDLMDVSRVMRGKIELRRELVRVAAIVSQAIETMQPAINAAGHRLTVNTHPELEVEADGVRLTQVISNLLGNAVKYTPAGGSIDITAREEEGHVTITVSDNGIGISPEMLPHIFDLFVQVDNSISRSQGGLGIGLTLVRSLVDLHGGEVSGKSAGAGSGTAFTVKLPYVGRAALDAISPPKSEVSGANLKGARILIIDDNSDAAESLGHLLEMRGALVHTFSDGLAALENPEMTADVIFLDLGMPGMDGFEVIRRLKKNPALEKTLFVALTGWGQPEDRRRSQESGFDLHLVKPLDPHDLGAVWAHPKLSRASGSP